MKLISLVIVLSLLSSLVFSNSANGMAVVGQSVSTGRQFISDLLFHYSSLVLSFETQEFLETLPGPLKGYREELDQDTWTAAEIIDYQAMRHGINPQLLLIILEIQDQTLTDPAAQIPTLSEDAAADPIQDTFYGSVGREAEQLVAAFAEKRSLSDEILVLPFDGEPVAIGAEINAGSYAVLKSLAGSVSREVWEQWFGGEKPLFTARFTEWFGDPLHGDPAAQSVTALPEGYMLPFPIGETWYLTSGPHRYVGETDLCPIGATRAMCGPEAWSSIDIAPYTPIPCNPNDPNDIRPDLNHWVVAARSGIVVDTSQARVVIDHGDGWRTYYSHISRTDKISNNEPVDQGERIGHPSCEREPGGSTYGIHLHFAIWHEGDGFVNINSSLLTNYQVIESTHYNGGMIRNEILHEASVKRPPYANNDLVNNVMLLSETFSDGNFNGWTIVDAPGAESAPSNWAVVQAKGSSVLRQNSNIHRLAEPYEGTYVFTGENWWKDYHLNVEIEPDDNDGLIVLFRYTDDNNFYRLMINRERQYRRLEKKVNGTYTTLAEDLANGYGTDGWINVQIDVAGNIIEVLLDHHSIFIFEDSAHPAGKIGLGTWANIDTYFDDVIVASSSVDPFADAVVDSYIKSSGNGHKDPMQILGRPQNHKDYDYASIGGPGYWVVVDMGQGEEIINGDGDDFRVYEIGDNLGGIDEEYNVSVSDSPTGPWKFIGMGWTTSVFDIANSGYDSVRYVRIDDLSTRTSGSQYPGSDIDAVQNLNPSGDLVLQAPAYIHHEVVRSDVVLTWASVQRAVGYNVYASRMGGGAGYTVLSHIPAQANAQAGNAAPVEYSYTHRGSAGNHYYYVITAISPEGFESAFSSEIPFLVFLPGIFRR